MPSQSDEEQARRLSDELADLSKKQSEALESAAYLKMSKEETAAFDRRQERIFELCALLSRFRPL